MKKYWIIENGHPIGPFTQDELRVRRDFTAALPVWCAELPDWTTVGRLPELACLLDPADENEEKPEEQTPAADACEAAAETPAPFVQPGVAAAQWIVTAPPDEIDGVQRPKSYMGWSILMLLCCCLPGGVAGLIFGSQVNRCWMRGDVKGAQKASEYVQWSIILSIVIGLVAWPFQMIFSFI